MTYENEMRPAVENSTVGWLFRARVEPPAGDDWLGPCERRSLAGFQVARRRQDWRRGRWVAKHLVAEIAGCRPGPAVEILPRHDGSPTVWIGGAEQAMSLSLSHRSGGALAAISDRASIGCDLEWIEPRSRAFVTDYFDRHEQERILATGRGDREVLVNALWSAKESALKLLLAGLTMDPLDLSVDAASFEIDRSWSEFSVRSSRREHRFHGWWRRSGSFVVTVVSEPATGPPTQFHLRTP